MMEAAALILLQVALAAAASDLQRSQIVTQETRIHLELSHTRRAQTELSYWQARKRAQKERDALPESAFTTPNTDLGGFRRIWDFYTPDYNCPLLKERVGRLGDGGKWVCGMRALLEDRPCMIFSLGSAGDISFESELLNRTSCEVHTFDPTLSQETEEAMLAALPDLHFHAVGIGRGSGGAPDESLNDKGFYSIEQVMGALSHQWLDVLKIDIENHEWDVFGDFYATPGARLPATQLLVEFHWPGNADRVWKVRPFQCTMKLSMHHTTALLIGPWKRCMHLKWSMPPVFDVLSGKGIAVRIMKAAQVFMGVLMSLQCDKKRRCYCSVSSQGCHCLKEVWLGQCCRSWMLFWRTSSGSSQWSRITIAKRARARRTCWNLPSSRSPMTATCARRTATPITLEGTPLCCCRMAAELSVLP